MQQISFDYFKPHFTIDKPVRLIELFAGIGSQAKALERLGVDFEKYIISEWEVEAIRSYKAIHFNDDNTDYSKDLNQKQLISALYEMGISSDGKELLTLQQVARHNENWLRRAYNNIKATHNIVNITNAKGSDLKIIDTDKFCYILTYSFPCQDLSLAGKQRGMSEGGQTRSSLLWEVKRLLYECKELPQVLIMENVTQVHSKKNADDFNRWIDVLSDLGYSNYFADLNAKNYGVPQNRNRTFMISILGDYFYEFPEPFKLQKRLKDILEAYVDEKYYLSQKGIDYITNTIRIKKKYTQINPDVAVTLTAVGNRNWTGSFITDEVIGSTQKNAYYGSLDGICPTLTTAMGTGGGNIPMIKKDDLVVNPLPLDEQNGYVRTDGCVGTIMTDGNSPKHNNRIIENANSIDNLKIRKLTPKECLRLMTFDDTDYEKIKAAGVVDTNIYKQAGNSIVVKVMEFIFASFYHMEVKPYEVGTNQK